MLNIQKKRAVYISILFLLISLLFIPKTFALGTSSQNCDVQPTYLIATNRETELLGLINTYRQENNLGVLKWSSVLKKAAAWQSYDMYSHSTFSHTDSLGRSPEARFTDCGYIWNSTGENIAYGDTTAQATFTRWKNSPAHNTIMLSAQPKDAGISAIGTYWTLDIGSTSAIYPTTSINPTQAISLTSTPGISSSPTPQITLSPTPTPAINTDPTDTQLHVSIKLPGIGETGNRSPKHLTRSVVIGIFDSENKGVLTGNGFLKYDGKNLFEGVIHLGQLANDTYSVKIKSTNTLISLVFPQFQNLRSDNINVLPFVILTSGDFNDDNTIDIQDYNLGLPCFQNKDCGGKSDVDLNDDGKKDVIDYNLFLSNFRQYEGD